MQQANKQKLKKWALYVSSLNGSSHHLAIVDSYNITHHRVAFIFFWGGGGFLSLVPTYFVPICADASSGNDGNTSCVYVCAYKAYSRRVYTHALGNEMKWNRYNNKEPMGRRFVFFSLFSASSCPIPFCFLLRVLFECLQLTMGYLQNVVIVANDLFF